MFKEKYNHKINFLIYTISLYISTIWINFYYISPINVDFHKYFGYVTYFLGADTNIDYGQSPFYYFLISVLFKRNINYVNDLNVDFILSYAIQNINLLLYIVGSLGLYKFLRLFDFSKSLILIALSFLNFFPQSIYIRAVMKPEVIAYAFFPWILYFLKKFGEKKEFKYLYFSIPFIAIVLTSKASIAAMIVLYLFIFYSKILKKINLKTLLFLFLILIVFISLVFVENYLITSNLFFERQYDPSYDNVADFNILFRLDIKKVFTDPFFDYEVQINKYSTHANSVINMTLLDTFGDYFNQLFDFNLNNFYKNRKDVFTVQGENLISSNRVVKYSGPYGAVLQDQLNKVRKWLSILFSIMFYFFVILLIYFDKKNKNIYLMPFIGIFVLYLNSLGIPSPNFNPFLADTFKTYYYSFFISITFVFVILKIFSKLKYFKIPLLIVWIFSIFFIGGHPKQNDQVFSEYMVISNVHSSFCEVNNLLFFENDLIKKIHKSGNINNLFSDCEKKDFSKTYVNQNPGLYGTRGEECIKENRLNNELFSTRNCRAPVIWYLFTNPYEENVRLPHVSILQFLLIIFIILFENNNLKKFKFISFYKQSKRNIKK